MFKADKIEEELRVRNESDGPMFKINNDPRVSGFGKILRSSSMDELPQLFNVLKGEMSLVGPRPLVMKEMSFCPSWRDARLTVSPGMTGLWQVSGQEKHFHEWIRYDTFYVQNQSMWIDIKILIKTIWKVFRIGRKTIF